MTETVTLASTTEDWTKSHVNFAESCFWSVRVITAWILAEVVSNSWLPLCLLSVAVNTFFCSSNLSWNYLRFMLLYCYQYATIRSWSGTFVRLCCITETFQKIHMIFTFVRITCTFSGNKWPVEHFPERHLYIWLYVEHLLWLTLLVSKLLFYRLHFNMSTHGVR